MLPPQKGKPKMDKRKLEAGIKRAAKDLDIPIQTRLVKYGDDRNDPHHWGFEVLFDEIKIGNRTFGNIVWVITDGGDIDFAAPASPRELEFHCHPHVRPNYAGFCLDSHSQVRIKNALQEGAFGLALRTAHAMLSSYNPSSPLMRPIAGLMLCDGCGEESEGALYMCERCKRWMCNGRECGRRRCNVCGIVCRECWGDSFDDISVHYCADHEVYECDRCGDQHPKPDDDSHICPSCHQTTCGPSDARAYYCENRSVCRQPEENRQGSYTHMCRACATSADRLICSQCVEICIECEQKRNYLRVKHGWCNYCRNQEFQRYLEHLAEEGIELHENDRERSRARSLSLGDMLITSTSPDASTPGPDAPTEMDDVIIEWDHVGVTTDADDMPDIGF